MSEPVEMSGFVTAKKKVHTLKDLRDLVAWADKYKVSDDSVVERSFSHMWISVIGTPDSVPATWIECGDHLAGDEHWDVLIETHQHPELEKYNGPDTYEEALELALDREPAPFDWPAIDRLNRYGDESRPE